METRTAFSMTPFRKHATKILMRHMLFLDPIVIMHVGGNEGCILNPLTDQQGD